MAWELTGNGGTNPATNFLGTTDNEPLVIRTGANGQERLRVNEDGNVGIGTATPGRRLSLEGGPELALRLRDNTIPTGAFWELQPTAFQSDYFGIVRYENGTAQGSKSLVIAPNGSVGIGTTSPFPTSRLEVYATGTDSAVSAISADGVAVVGNSSNGSGVQGISTSQKTDAAGVNGYCPEGTGVFGSGGMIGVLGSTTNANGVVGKNAGDVGAGVTGITSPIPNSQAGLGTGVAGFSTAGAGVFGNSQKGYGVSGYSSNNWSGHFGGIDPGTQGVYITVPAGQPGLQVASGTKSAVVATSQGTRALHTEESTAVWFTDYGFGHLQAGRTVITIDPLFAETVNLSEPYHVFVQLNDPDAEGVAVVNKTASSFEVVELRNGQSNAEFSYRLVAKRRGYETHRLEQAPWADEDPNLYPEKRSAWEAQQRLRRPEIPQVEVPPRPTELPR